MNKILFKFIINIFTTKNYLMAYIVKSMMVLLVSYLIIIEVALGGDSNNSDWRNQSLSSLAQSNSDCLEAPATTVYNNASVTLSVEKNDWVATGLKVATGKDIKFEWEIKSLTLLPRKYLVLFRLDPRFDKPQIFIQQYDNLAKTYKSDFHAFNGGILVKNQNNATIIPIDQATAKQALSDRITQYNNYFNFVGRNKIPVYNDEIINITLISAGDFFTPNGDFLEELSYPYYPLTAIYTDTGLPDNVIISASGEEWCNAITKSASYTPNECLNNLYLSTNFNKLHLSGVLPPLYPDIIKTLKPCDPNVDINLPGTLCIFDDSRGVNIQINGQTVKEGNQPFIFSAINHRKFFYIKSTIPSTTNGYIDFTTPINMSNEFQNFPQLMNQWKNVYISDDNIISEITNNHFDIRRKSHHFGRYFFSLEIGEAEGTVPTNRAQNIDVEYTIFNGRPDSTAVTNIITSGNHVTSNKDGYIWIRTANKDPNLPGGIDPDLQGTVNVNIINYTGSTMFSDFLYNKVIKYILSEFAENTQRLYNGILAAASTQFIARVLLSLYVMFYACYFLIGAVQITSKDLVIRIGKILIITTIIAPNSWAVFSKYFVSIFSDGLGYFFTLVGGGSTVNGNMFTFLDPILDKYINPRMWQLLGIQLLQISNGLIVFSILSIYSLLIFFRSILQVIIYYVMAAVGMSVMIGLAPFFFMLMLFERTKSIFDNWVSTLFDYMIKPTILLIFFLFIDQVVSTQINNIVLRACWGELLDIEIGISLLSFGLPVSYAFGLPFLPNIPFWVPQIENIKDVSDLYTLNGTFLNLITSSILFYCFCNMASGLVAYTTEITAALTQVTAARREGMFVNQEDVTNSIISDATSLVKPLTKPIKYVGSTFKRKVIDQDYEVKEKNNDKPRDKPESYGSKIRSNRND